MSSSSSTPSSPLSSVASRSPSLPVDYPSPPSSSLSDVSSQLSDAPEGLLDSDCPPPAKKRKTAPNERGTEYLDLFRLNDSDDDAFHRLHDPKLAKLLKVLHSKKRIVVIAGAGISVSAGIPDFRSSTGLFTTLRSQHKLKSSGKHLFDASVYRDDSSTSSFHDMVRELSQQTKIAQPTPFHHMLASLAEQGRLMRLYTQNVDGIDTSLEPLATNVPLNKKGPWPKTIQLHGGLNKMVCSKCGHLSEFDGHLFEGPEAPSCQECVLTDQVRVVGGLRSHGIGCLRPRMVLYNEFNPDEEAIGAVSHADLKRGPDAVIVVGTSLKVPGIRRLAKEMCAVTRGRRGGFTAWINFDPEPTDFKDLLDLVVRGESDDVARNLGLPKWDDTDPGAFSLVTKEDQKANGGKLSVVVESLKTEGFLTPGASPRQQSPRPVLCLAKSKQTQLSFVSGLAPGKDSKVKKPRIKPAAPKIKSKITNAFNSGKNSQPTAGKDLIGSGMDYKSICSSVFPHDGFPGDARQGPLSSDYRTNSESHIPKSNFEIQIPKRTPLPSHSDISALNPPSTPPSRAFDRDATISPRSVPSGMEGLIS